MPSAKDTILVRYLHRGSNGSSTTSSNNTTKVLSRKVIINIKNMKPATVIIIKFFLPSIFFHATTLIVLSTITYVQ